MRCVTMLANLWHARARRDGDGLLDDRVERGGDARRAGDEVAVARAPRGGRQAGRRPEHRHGRQRPGVLGEVRELLGRRDRGSCPWAPRRYTDAGRARSRCATRTPSAWSPSSARRSTASTSRSRRSADALDQLEKDTGLDIPLHVDGASGGFIAPFIDPDLEWDFRIPRVVSINASGHKFGLVYPGVGWVIWRDPEHLPEDLVFHVNYLGGDMPTFALNFSRPGAQVVGAVLQVPPARPRGLLRASSRRAATPRATWARRSRRWSRSPWSPTGPACRCSPSAWPTARPLHRVRRLRGAAERGWQVPAYTFPENLQDIAVLRIVVRNGFSRDLGRVLLEDIGRETVRLEKRGGAPREDQRESFHH